VNQGGVDRQQLWRIAAANRARWQNAAPERHEAVIEVTVAGKPPFIVGRVETSRRPEDPWVFLYAFSTTDFERQTPEDHMLITQEHNILAVEIRYRRTEAKPIGFTHGEITDPATVE
jgi:hypothetical protein